MGFFVHVVAGLQLHTQKYYSISYDIGMGLLVHKIAVFSL